MKKMRDSQRSKVYAWEREQPWWATRGYRMVSRRGNCISSVSSGPKGDPAQFISLDECQKLVDTLWASYPHQHSTTPAPDVRDGRGRRHACGSSRRISLPLWARTTSVVCHELAHSICFRNGVQDPGHGAYFVGVYARLLSLAGLASEASVLRSAVDSGLKAALIELR